MKNIANIAGTNWSPAFFQENAEQSDLKQLEVNVIFTGTKATTVALKTASSLAANLEGCIRIRAAFAVPMRLPLDHPQISIAFVEKLLADIVSQAPADGPETTGHIYLCRERTQAFSQALHPNSLVVIAGPKRPWPTAESRLARHLESEGHRVIFVPLGRKTEGAIAGGERKPNWLQVFRGSTASEMTEVISHGFGRERG
jgi:hypothetical protein